MGGCVCVCRVWGAGQMGRKDGETSNSAQHKPFLGAWRKHAARSASHPPSSFPLSIWHLGSVASCFQQRVTRARRPSQNPLPPPPPKLRRRPRQANKMPRREIADAKPAGGQEVGESQTMLCAPHPCHARAHPSKGGQRGGCAAGGEARGVPDLGRVSLSVRCLVQPCQGRLSPATAAAWRQLQADDARVRGTVCVGMCSFRKGCTSTAHKSNPTHRGCATWARSRSQLFERKNWVVSGAPLAGWLAAALPHHPSEGATTNPPTVLGWMAARWRRGDSQRGGQFARVPPPPERVHPPVRPPFPVPESQGCLCGLTAAAAGHGSRVGGSRCAK